MIRGLCVLLLGAGLLFAQEEDDDEGGIVIDEAPPAGAEPEAGDAAPAPATARPARAPGKRPRMVKVEEGAYSMRLPEDWVLQRFDAAKAELGWDVLLPGSTHRARLLLVRQEDMGDPRAAPYWFRDGALKQEPGATAEVRSGGAPRLILRRDAGDGETATMYLFLAVKRNPYFLQFDCAASDFEQAERDLLAAAKSFTAEVELWPPIPDGYETSTVGPWLVAQSPNVKDSLRALEKVLKDQEKRFRKFHGALPKSDASIVVLVHGTPSEAAKIEPRAGEAQDGYYVDARGQRLFAVPVNKNNIESQALLAGAAQGLLFVVRYGDMRPQWIVSGERTVARAEWMTGRPLPSLHEGFVHWADGLSFHRCDELEELIGKGVESWGKETFFYVCMLRAGKFKKQYKAFLDELAMTGDGPGAYAHHIGTIDAEELKAATNDFIYGKIRPVKPK